MHSKRDPGTSRGKIVSIRKLNLNQNYLLKKKKTTQKTQTNKQQEPKKKNKEKKKKKKRKLCALSCKFI